MIATRGTVAPHASRIIAADFLTFSTWLAVSLMSGD
jgi:hypothetical protein